MKKITSALLLSLVFCSLVVSGEKGTYNFLRNDVGARAAGLNGSFVSMSNDPNLIFYNPAGLTTIDRPLASVGFLKHLLDVNGGHLAYAQPLDPIGTIGAGISFLDYGSFTETDESMNTLGTFGARDIALVIGAGRTVDEATTVGVSAKFIYSSIADIKSAAMAFDAGVLYRISSENITIGASILHVGTQVNSYLETKESLPVDFKMGITKRPEHLPVLLNLNFHKLNESHENFFQRFTSFSLGAEFVMSESVRLRIGYNNEQRKELKLGNSSGLAGFSLGGGIVVGEYIVDYAFNSYGKIGSLHRVSVGMGW